MRVCQLIIIAGFCLCGLMADARSLTGLDYNSRVWQTEDGLPHNIVQAITQSRDGYLWIGTREGLACFDGVHFQTITLMQSSPDPSITALAQSKDGSIWIGTDTSGIFRLCNGLVERYADPAGNTNFNVQDIQEGVGGIWITSSHKIFRWVDGKMEQMADSKSEQQTLCVDSSGSVWTIGNGVLKCLAGSGTNQAQGKARLPQFARALYRDQDGPFWIGAGNGLIRLKDGEGKNYRKSDGPSGFVSVIFRDSAGTMWIGTYTGVSRFIDGKFVDQGNTETSAYRVYEIFEDKEHNLWVGSEEGLMRLTPKLFNTITKKDGLTLNTVATVCAGLDGKVWISAWGSGLNCWVDGQISSLTTSNGLSSNFIMAMCAGRDGSLWAGADYGGALNRINDGKISIYGQEMGFIVSSTTATTALYEDRQGVLWIGSRELLQRWDGRNFSSFTTKDGLADQKINAICGGADGSVWIGTEGGLTLYREGRFENLARTDLRLQTSILSLYEDADGVLWIGTRGHGLLRLNAGALNSFTSRQGLFSDTIYSILEDGRGNLWLNSSRGIFWLKKSEIVAVVRGQSGTLNSVSYGKVDGILSSGQYREVTQPSACKDTTGRLWFRTTQGVAVVNPDQVKSNELPPPVVIQEILADRQPVDTGSLEFEASPQITLKPGRGELELHYAALSFRAPEKNQFRYKLEGVDMDWVEAGTRRVAFYSNLRPGHYQFQLQACNNDGLWNKTGATVSLVLEPHFWETRWFMALIILSAAGVVGGSARFITRRRMARRLALLEQQHAVEKERARIARDMHDELGAKLTRISFQGAMALRCQENPPNTDEHITKMSETARELVLSLDQIVWAVDPENDSLESLANYICRYAGEFVENSPIHCKFNIPRKLPACHLSTEVRHNIFLAVKEALNNVLKHSGATHVLLTISADAGRFEVAIADDGHGLADPTDVPSGGPRRVGHGLVNMRERLVSINGIFELKSKPGRGVEVRFIVPLSDAPIRTPYVYPNGGTESSKLE